MHDIFFLEDLVKVNFLVNTAEKANWTIFYVESSPESSSFKNPKRGELKSIRLYRYESKDLIYRLLVLFLPLHFFQDFA